MLKRYWKCIIGLACTSHGDNVISFFFLFLFWELVSALARCFHGMLNIKRGAKTTAHPVDQRTTKIQYTMLKMNNFNQTAKSVTAPMLILSLVLFSCQKSGTKEPVIHPDSQAVHTTEVSATENNTSDNEQRILSTSLAGKWKETTYPYRTAEFTGSTVKFVEEGTEHDPQFEKYELGNHCKFENNNIKETRSVLLILPEARRCEQIAVSGDTLTLSGYSTNTKDDYKITYVRIK